MTAHYPIFDPPPTSRSLANMLGDLARDLFNAIFDKIFTSPVSLNKGSMDMIIFLRNKVTALHCFPVLLLSSSPAASPLLPHPCCLAPAASLLLPRPCCLTPAPACGDVAGV